MFGPYDQPNLDAFHVYAGDEPYFRSAKAQRWLARADAIAMPGRSQRLLAGGFAWIVLTSLCMSVAYRLEASLHRNRNSSCKSLQPEALSRCLRSRA